MIILLSGLCDHLAFFAVDVFAVCEIHSGFNNGLLKMQRESVAPSLIKTLIDLA